jgi:hypothetical protein
MSVILLMAATAIVTAIATPHTHPTQTREKCPLLLLLIPAME